jgi:glycosyltransferase involved in cell wall biosynthesis
VLCISLSPTAVYRESEIRRSRIDASTGCLRALRVLSVISGPVFGGAHNQALLLADPLERAGWATTVVLPDDPGDAAERLRACGIDVVSLPMQRLRITANPLTHLRFAVDVPGQVERLRTVMRTTRPDVVQVHGPVHPHPALAAGRTGPGIVWQLLDTRPPMFVRRATMPLVTRLADVIMTVGRSLVAAYPGAARLGERVIPYCMPVVTADFVHTPERRARARQLLQVREPEMVVGSIGNRNPQKGFEDLIDAFALVRRKLPAVLRIRGAESTAHPGYAERLSEKSRAAGLDDATLGAVPKEASVADLLPGMDVFVLSSVPRSEGIPTAILEAMASRLPVVATNVGAVHEAVAEGTTGYLVPPRRPDLLANRIADVLTRPDRGESLGIAGRQRVNAEFTLEHSLRSHLRAYEMAVDRAAQRRR